MTKPFILSTAIVSLYLFPLPTYAQDLPAALELRADDLIPTLDGSGNHVGRLSNFHLTLTREYSPTNVMLTRYNLVYFYGNGNQGETQGGSQSFTIDLLDANGHTIVSNVIGPVAVPRYRCWYGGGSSQQYPVDGSLGTVKFDYTGKSINSMRVNVNRVQGGQGLC